MTSNLEKGKRLRELRKRMGLTQVEFSRKLRLDPGYISQLEHGHRNVDEVYVELAEGLWREFEKSQKVGEPERLQEEGAPYGARTTEQLRAGIRDYMERLIEEQGESLVNLGWLAKELPRSFPLSCRPGERDISDSVRREALSAYTQSPVRRKPGGGGPRERRTEPSGRAGMD